MARIRTIKPEFFTSLTVADLSYTARLTFIGLWTHVDDEGRCVDDARLVKAAVWPLDDRTSVDVEQDLQVLSESSLIVRYEVGGRSFLAVRGWREHQKINRPTKSRIPAPSDGTPRPPRTVPRPAETSLPAETPPVGQPDHSNNGGSRTTHAQLTEDSLAERNREQGTGNRERTTPAPPNRPATDLVAAVVSDDAGADNLPAIPAPENAGQILAAWIDHCRDNEITLTKRLIGQYAKGIKTALDQGFKPNLIKTALANMLAEGVADRPSYLDNHVVRVQQHARRARATPDNVIQMPARPSTTDQRVAQALALAAKYDAMEASRDHTG